MPKVPLQGLTLGSLSEGYAGKVIDDALTDVTRDLVRRGHDGKKRTVTITLDFIPDGDTAQCQIDVNVGVKLPGYRPPKTIARFDQAAGGLVFRTESAGHPDQPAIPGTRDEADDE